MPIIKPISDLRNHSNEISKLCHQGGEPVFITRNGQGDLVVMSLALYERIQASLELYQKLGEAEADSQSEKRRIPHKEVMKKARSKISG
ncbi:MAG: type II toxin-antitoxin system Phd/YefM family antitoxin [Armatimonadetes bacterium]|nr:type II toxin-antitoxin system Phd/YefM family antitoxin [Armatimonadota bacterium]